MREEIQVKGTLPLVAEFLNTTEKRIYEIFNLNKKGEIIINVDEKGGEEDGTTNQSETIQPSEDSV